MDLRYKTVAGVKHLTRTTTSPYHLTYGCAGDVPTPPNPPACLITPAPNTADLFFEVQDGGAPFRDIVEAYGGCSTPGGTDVLLYADELSALGIPTLHYIGGNFHEGRPTQRYAKLPDCPAIDPDWYTKPAKYEDQATYGINYLSGGAFQTASPSLYALGWRCGWLFTVGPNMGCPQCGAIGGGIAAFGAETSTTYLYYCWKLVGDSETDGDAKFRPAEYFGGDSASDAASLGITIISTTGSVHVHS